MLLIFSYGRKLGKKEKGYFTVFNCLKIENQDYFVFRQISQLHFYKCFVFKVLHQWSFYLPAFVFEPCSRTVRVSITNKANCFWSSSELFLESPKNNCRSRDIVKKNKIKFFKNHSLLRCFLIFSSSAFHFFISPEKTNISLFSKQISKQVRFIPHEHPQES